MISKELQQTIEDWYVLKTYGDVHKNLHRDIQADIDHYFDATGNYGQVLSNNDWAALCKEWAWGNGFYYWYENNRLYIKKPYSCKVDFEIDIGKFKKPFDVKIDFKACQWIYDNRSEK